MRIAACDVDADYLRNLERLLRQIHTIDAATIMFYSDPDWLAADVRQHEDAFDILIINSKLGEASGIELAKCLLNENPWCKLIFICDNDIIVPEFFSVRHSFILSKKQVIQYLPRAIEKVVSEVASEDSDIISVTSNYTKLLLSGNEIFYIERVLRKSHIVLRTEVVETFSTPAQILGCRIGKRYTQCHRSFYVNLSKIRGLQSDHFILSNSMTVPIGRSYHEQAEKAFEYASKSLASAIPP